MSRFQQKNSETYKEIRAYSSYAGERSQLNKLNFHTEKLGKRKQLNPKKAEKGNDKHESRDKVQKQIEEVIKEI